jgi:hypothetical protein
MIGKIIEEIEEIFGRLLIGLAIAIAGGLIGYYGTPILMKLGLI